MAEIRNLTRNGETFYPLTHEKAVIGMEDFKDTITEQIDNYRPIEITGNVTNAPDEEDITSDSNNLLKFKNRNNLYGLGKVILRRSSTFASQVTQANTIYVIQYNFDLYSARINIPNGSILLFEGGTLSNGTLVCADLYDVLLVYYQDQSEILSSVTLEGNFIHKACDKDTIREILVDNSSITKDANDVLSVKANGIQNNHLNSNVVDASSIILDSNNKISIKNGGVTGAKLNSTIVNTDDLRFNMNIAGSYMGLDISGFYIESSGNAIDLCYEHGGHTGTNVHNITIKAPNGAGITTTISTQNVYGCNFENIRFTYCKYCMANMSLMLNTTIKNCIDFTCRIWFYNCFFQETYFIGGNVGWGHHLHFIYADKSWRPFGMIRYSLYVIGCNFEEFESNMVVIKKPTDYPGDTPIYYLTFDNCNFNNPQLSGHNIYDFDNEYSNLVEKTYTSYSEYYPIVGYEIVPKFINCRSNIKNDNNQEVSIPIYAHTYNYSSHTDFNEIGAVIYVHAFLSDSWFNFIYNGKKVVSFKEMLDDPVISAKFTKFNMFYLRLGTRDSIFVNDSNSNSFSIDFDQNDWSIGNSFRIVSKNSKIVLLQGFASSGMNMNKSASYNYFGVGGQYFNTGSKKILTCTGSEWVDATGTLV